MTSLSQESIEDKWKLLLWVLQFAGQNTSYTLYPLKDNSSWLKMCTWEGEAQSGIIAYHFSPGKAVEGVLSTLGPLLEKHGIPQPKRPANAATLNASFHDAILLTNDPLIADRLNGVIAEVIGQHKAGLIEHLSHGMIKKETTGNNYNSQFDLKNIIAHASPRDAAEIVGSIAGSMFAAVNTAHGQSTEDMARGASKPGLARDRPQ